MSRTRPYGRAFKISESEARAYERTTKPRAYRPNPLGVTAMASVNGRGAYGRSARAVAAGKTRAQLDSRARQVMRNGEKEMPRRAGFLRNKRSLRPNEYAHEGWAAVAEENEQKAAAAAQKQAKAKKSASYKIPGKLPKSEQNKRKKLRMSRTNAYQAALRDLKKSSKAKGLSKEDLELKAKRSALRKVPLLPGEIFKGTGKRWVDPKKAAARKRAKTKVGVASTRKTLPAHERTYERVYLTDPRTGKRTLSWMYRDAAGRLRRIPAKPDGDSALWYPRGHAKAGKARRGGVSSARAVAARAKAAKKLMEEGGVFVPNKSAKSKKRGKRLAAYNAFMKGKKPTAANKAKAAAFADKAVGIKRKPAAKKPAKKRRASAAKKATRKTTKAAARKPTKRRKTAKKATRKTVGTRKAPARKTSKKRAARRYTKATRVVHCVPAKRRKKAKKSTTKRKSRKMKRNGSDYAYSKTKHPHVIKRRKVRKNRRSMSRNQFAAKLIQVLKTGALVAGGFIAHKVLTGLASKYVFDKFAATAPATLQTWKNPICGAVVLAVGVPATRMVAPKVATEVVSGMAASFIQSLIVSALNSMGQPTWATSLSGYSNSRAYGLRGPVERHAASIMPRYAPVSGYLQAAAGFQQAAAGMGAVRQAAAGFRQAAAGTGEYFTANATGEYFAPNSLEGVGSYEGAGQLAMQASQVQQDIDDGIRPDSDIDGIMDLAEAAAGLRGMGEYYSAVKSSAGRFVEQRVGQQSQWVPSGPLWAGDELVDDTQATSELSAGILQRPGGNGSLSA